MKLHELMDDAVGDVTVAPAERYLATARRGATRRRVLRAAGAAAAAAAVVVGGMSLAGGHLGGGDTVQDWASFDIPTPEPDQPLVRADGRSTAAALIAALNDVLGGEESYSNVEGNDSIDSSQDDTASAAPHVALTLAAGAAQGTVEIELDPFRAYPPDHRPCGHYVPLKNEVGPGVTESEPAYQLRTSCTSTALSNGDTLAIAHFNIGPALAEVISPRRRMTIRLAFDGDGHVLTDDQAAKIVEEPWWGITVPQSLAAAGEALSPYVDRSDPCPLRHGSFPCEGSQSPSPAP